MLRFSIVTPSFRHSAWLQLCIASVADQAGVEVEHIVQDACSDDGTQEWLPKDPRVKAFIEKDLGMYDAVNRGFRRATGDLLAYLNCDEQYLPGALAAVRDYFAAHPSVDVVLTDTVVADTQGNYLCHRYSLVPGPYQIWVRFPALTCALFVRARVVRELGIHFDTQWRALGDVFWVREMLRKRVRMAILPRFTSVFSETNENLCLTPRALEERQRAWQMAPAWVRRCEYLFVLLYRLQLAARGSLFQRPFDYSLFTLANPNQRVTRRATRPTSFWPAREATT
jgi:glycosyltransferase involved in cell wall biosynthesis